MLGGEPLHRRVMRGFAMRAMGAVMTGGIVVALFLVAFVFFAAAFYFWLSEHMGAPLAALGTGIAALLTAFAILAVGRIAQNRHAAKRGTLEREVADVIGEDSAQTIFKAIERHGIAASLAALVAGVVVGATPRLRQLLSVFFKV